MNLKALLKSIKINESAISMILGILVIITVGILVVRYFKNVPGQLPGDSEATDTNTEDMYVVKENDTLWSIAEENFGTGYDWKDIAEANDIQDPNEIEVGQELKLPEEGEAPIETPEPITEDVQVPDDTKLETPTATPKMEIAKSGSIVGPSYTVVKGDTLWDIAVRAYGDGYKWTEIAKENKLANPDLIHPGNVFTLPR